MIPATASMKSELIWLPSLLTNFFHIIIIKATGSIQGSRSSINFRHQALVLHRLECLLLLPFPGTWHNGRPFKVPPSSPMRELILICREYPRQKQRALAGDHVHCWTIVATDEHVRVSRGTYCPWCPKPPNHTLLPLSSSVTACRDNPIPHGIRS